MAYVDDELLAIADATLAEWGDTFTRIRPVSTIVNGRTVKDWESDVTPGLHGRTYLRSGRIRERGWAIEPAGLHEIAAESTSGLQVDDLVDMTSGRYSGTRFRVTAVDPLVPIAALELVPGN